MGSEDRNVRVRIVDRKIVGALVQITIDLEADGLAVPGMTGHAEDDAGNRTAFRIEAAYGRFAIASIDVGLDEMAALRHADVELASRPAVRRRAATA